MKFKKPQIYLWATAILILVIAFIRYDSESVIDINVHDTYFVIHHLIITELIAGLLFIEGILYWIFQKANRKLNKMLTKVHLIVTIGGIMIYPIIISLLGWNNENSHEVLNIVWAMLILVILFAQILFILNLLTGLLKRNNNTGRQSF